MPELPHRLEKLTLRLDHMGMRVEQAVNDALHALKAGDPDAGEKVHQDDSIIDRTEVEIEQECIRCLALYQPAAVDLRRICTIIKINSDLERIADLASGIGKVVKDVVKDDIHLDSYHGFDRLCQAALDSLGRTMRILATADADVARRVIQGDKKVDAAYREIVQSVLETESRRVGGAEPATTMLHICRALERIGDLCANICEDVIFLSTGDIVRHAGAFGEAS